MADHGGHGELLDKGLAMRRAVLGAEYVDRSIANAEAFTQPFQKLVTKWCWARCGTGLGSTGRRAASSICPRTAGPWRAVPGVTALNRPNEVRLHVRGALNNGVTREEIQEVLLHTTVYCGVPAALESFRIAAEVLKEEDANQR